MTTADECHFISCVTRQSTTWESSPTLIYAHCDILAITLVKAVSFEYPSLNAWPAKRTSIATTAVQLASPLEPPTHFNHGHDDVRSKLLSRDPGIPEPPIISVENPPSPGRVPNVTETRQFDWNGLIGRANK